MDESIDNYKKNMDDFIERTIRNGIINYCKKSKWIKYENNHFIIIDENIKKKIHKDKFSSAIEVIDVIKLYLKENNCFSRENTEDESWESFTNNAIGE